MKKVVNLLGHGLFYTIAISIESLAPFILAPVLTHYISVYEYGLWAIFQSVTAFLRPLLGFTLDDYVRMRFYRQSREKMVGYLLSIILLSGTFAALLCLVAITFGPQISALLEFPETWLCSMVICAWLHALFYIFLAYYQFDARHARYAIIHAVQALATLFLSVALVMSGWGWQGAVIGKVIGLSCGAGLAWYWIARHFPKEAGKHLAIGRILDLAAFSMRYLPNGMVVVVIIMTDRLMLAHTLGVQAASLFSIASLFPMVLVIAIQGFLFGWQPWCFRRLSRHEPQDPPQLLLGIIIYIIGLPIGAIILTCLSSWLGPYVIDEQFHPAFDFVPILMAAMVAQGFYQLAQSILHYYHRLILLSLIALVTMGINIGLNMILIDRLGTIGSAWATWGAYTIAFLVTTFLAWKILHRNYLVPIKETESKRV